jgi:hypothetical protein
MRKRERMEKRSGSEPREKGRREEELAKEERRKERMIGCDRTVREE